MSSTFVDDAGIIIGVAAVIALVSVGQGSSAYVTGQFESPGSILLAAGFSAAVGLFYRSAKSRRR
jgi:ABC-type antimicrobial peptide transport system permease subunit